MNIVCIIQARTTSTRLPNKVLLSLPYESEITVLEQVISRVKKSKLITDIIVATTVNRTDDAIEELCSKLKINVYRGSEDNVLERYYLSAKEYKSDLVVRITSDCPCIDWEIIDSLIEKHLEEKNDYTSNTLIRTFPHGVDSEVFTFKVLEEAYLNAKEKFEIEHVTPYIHKTNRDKFKIGILEANELLKSPKIRITLDTKEDYDLLCAVYDYLYDKNNFFTTIDIVNLFKEKSWLYRINGDIIQKEVCKNLDEEIEESLKLLDKQDLNRAHKYLKEQYYGK